MVRRDFAPPHRPRARQKPRPQTNRSAQRPRSPFLAASVRIGRNRYAGGSIGRIAAGQPLSARLRRRSARGGRVRRKVASGQRLVVRKEQGQTKKGSERFSPSAPKNSSDPFS